MGSSSSQPSGYSRELKRATYHLQQDKIKNDQFSTKSGATATALAPKVVGVITSSSSAHAMTKDFSREIGGSVTMASKGVCHMTHTVPKTRALDSVATMMNSDNTTKLSGVSESTFIALCNTDTIF
jgi:hypothetical protein